MKARVKATGEIVEVISVGSYINEFGTLVGEYKNADGIMYMSYDLDFYIEDNIIVPDYWEKLKHQYAGMAMQGLLSNDGLLTTLCNGNKDVPLSEIVASNANFLATALVNKLKGDKV